MQTTVSNMMVVSAASKAEDDNGKFQMLDQDGALVFEHTIEK